MLTNQAPTSESNTSNACNAYTQLDDDRLMGLVLQGNHDAFAGLVRRHTSLMLGLARRTLNNVADADDVVQAVFIKLWQAPQAWDSDKAALTTWLYRVVLNACYDLGRVKSRHVNAQQNIIDLSDGSEMHVTSTLELITNSSELQQRQQLLQQALRQLPQAQRDAINLVVFTGLPQKQVADVLGISVKAVESLLVRARRNLKKHVEAISSQTSSQLISNEGSKV